MADMRERDRVPPQVADSAADADDFDADLNPNNMQGQNLSPAGVHPQKHARTVRDIKELQARFDDWLRSDLEEIPVMPEGSRLEQGATYIDLRDEQPTEFTATGGMQAEPGRLLVPKSDVPFEIWNRLIGVKNVMRTGVKS
jgi:hypothetical protein